MFNWLKKKLAGDELRRKDETIQHYRELLRNYEVNHAEFNRVKLKAEILEMHLEQGVILDDAINSAINKKRSEYIHSVAQGDYQQAAHLAMYWQNTRTGQGGLAGLAGIFGTGFFQ